MKSANMPTTRHRSRSRTSGASNYHLRPTSTSAWAGSRVTTGPCPR
jgi:hypothetical protein